MNPCKAKVCAYSCKYMDGFYVDSNEQDKDPDVENVGALGLKVNY